MTQANDTATLARIWANGRGIVGQLTAVNHSTIGLRFIATGLVFLLVSGVLSMFIRLQLAWPGNTVLDAHTYNQFVTMHGTTMMFLFAVPIMEGFAMYLLPKMLGARDLPLPRLGAFGYWCYLFGGLMLYASFFFGEVPDGGWFMYPPLTGSTFSPGRGADFWLIGVTFSEIAAVAGAVELIVAILITRAPGMDIQRMPLFAWYLLVTAFMIAFGFPPLILGSILLELERAFGFVFYDVALGGDPLLWQHLFWLFGHPEVYIIFLPAAGVVTMVVSTFARRPSVGYTWIVLAIVATGFLSFGLWVHHMFAVGIPLLALSFFSAASMAVAIPMGIQVFAWIATLWAGRPWLRLPSLYLAGFFVVFVLGGLTGVMLALVPFDWQVHDTHFVVAHLHYVLIGGLMFPMFAGLYYWLPLVSGRLPNESLGRTAFWLVFIGFNLAFLPMHLTGLAGMPRRVYTYTFELGVHWLNLLSTAAGFVLAIGMVAILLDIALAWRHGRAARRNPWRAGTLEWALPFPVPNYNFASIPRVTGRDALWETPGLAESSARTDGLLGDASHGRREMLGTSLLGGVPEQVIRLSHSTWWPLLAALGVAAVLTGLLAKIYWLSALMLVPLACIVGAWLWTGGDRSAPDAIDAGAGVQLPVHMTARNAPGWWATVISLLVDGSLFASLVFAYFYLWLGADAWPPMPVAGTSWWLVAGAAGVLGLGEVVMRWAQRRRTAGADKAFRAGLLATWLCGASFLALHAGVLLSTIDAPQVHAYTSVVWTLAGFHAVHVLVAMFATAFVWLRSRAGLLRRPHDVEPRVAAALWRYAMLQGLLTLAVIHIFPVTL